MPEAEVLGLTSRWLRYAREDLALAQEIFDGGRPARLSCFHAQQATEKALKAVLVFEQLDFHRTHDLVELGEAVPSSWSVPLALSELADLSRWAVESRYPPLDEPDAADAERALVTARPIVEAVAGELELRGVE